MKYQFNRDDWVNIYFNKPTKFNCSSVNRWEYPTDEVLKSLSMEQARKLNLCGVVTYGGGIIDFVFGEKLRSNLLGLGKIIQFDLVKEGITSISVFHRNLRLVAFSLKDKYGKIIHYIGQNRTSDCQQDICYLELKQRIIGVES